MKRSLILFTRNEIEGLRTIFPKIPFEIVDEVLAVDGHSTDGCVEYLQDKGIRVVQQKRLGRGNAMIEAVEQCSGDIIAFLSSDGNEDPRAISQLIGKLGHCDMAVASRFMKEAYSDDSDDPLLIRRFGNRLFTSLVNLIWNANVTDATNGLRAIRRSAWNKLGIDSEYHEAEFQMTIRAAKLGMKIAEIPTVEGRRIGGKRYASTWKMAWTFTKHLIREIWVGSRFRSRMGDTKRHVQRHYDQLAPVYEPKKRKFYLHMIRDSIEHLKGDRVADFGCGTGLALSWFNGERVGVDFSRELLRLAHKGPEYVLADVESVPFRNECFDLVLCLDVVEHLPSLKIVEEAHRILTVEGIFLLSTADKRYGLMLSILEKLGLKLPEGPHQWRDRQEIIRKISNVGFSCAQWSRPPINFYRCTKPKADDAVTLARAVA